MDEIRFRTKVRNKDVADDIEDAIEDGIRKAATGSLPNDMEMVARLKIIEEDAIWREILINSFNRLHTWRAGNHVLIFENTTDYAAPVNDGAEYGDEGPPLAALIPWVRTHLYFWESGEDDGDSAAIYTDGSGIGGPPEVPYTKAIDTDKRIRNVEKDFIAEGGGVNHETFAKIEFEDGSTAFAKLPELGRLSSDYDAVRNEVMFTRIQGEMDWELGPEARWSTVEINGESYDGVVQAFVEDKKRLKSAFIDGDITKNELLQDYQDELAQGFLSHLLLDNNDFHENNALIGDDGTLHFIDNGGNRLTGNAFDLRGVPIGNEVMFLDLDNDERQDLLNDLLDRQIELADDLADKSDEILENFRDVHGENHYLVDRAEFLLENNAEELKKFIENYRDQLNDKFDGTSDELVPRLSELSGETSAQDTTFAELEDEDGILGEMYDEFAGLGEDQSDKDTIDDVSDEFLP